MQSRGRLLSGTPSAFCGSNQATCSLPCLGGCGFKLLQASEHLGDAPILSDTPSRRVWLERVEDLADAADAAFAQMSAKAGKELERVFTHVRMHAKPRIEVRADQPRPHSALMVRGVASAQITEILSFEVRMTGIEGPEAVSREQASSDGIDDRRPTCFVEDRMAERKREDLVGTARRIVARLAIDDVVQISAGVKPEASIE